MSLRPPPKIAFRHDLNWTRGNIELGSTVEQQPVGKFVQQSFGEALRAQFSKPTEQEVDGKRLQEEFGSSDGTGKISGDCKEYSSFTTKSGYENCTCSMMSNEDNNHDTNYIKKHTDTNIDTRKVHE